MRTAALLCFLLLLPFGSFCATSRAIATYLDLRDNAIPMALAADPTGNLVVASNITSLSGDQQIRISRTDLQGNTLSTIDFGSSLYGQSIVGISTDAANNVILVGNTSAAQKLPLVSPVISTTSSNAAYVMKFDPRWNRFVYRCLGDRN